MFKQGKRPSVIVQAGDRRRLERDLRASGYEPHHGPRVVRPGELRAWRAPVGHGRQVHVQEVRAARGRVEVFAHTEPAGAGFEHAVSAVFDGANFAAGSRVLRGDLRARGWQIGGRA